MLAKTPKKWYHVLVNKGGTKTMTTTTTKLGTNYTKYNLEDALKSRNIAVSNYRIIGTTYGYKVVDNYFTSTDVGSMYAYARGSVECGRFAIASVYDLQTGECVGKFYGDEQPVRWKRA